MVIPLPPFSILYYYELLYYKPLRTASYDAKSLKTEEQDAGDYGLTQKKSVIQFVQEWHNLAEDIFNEDEQVQVFLQVSGRSLQNVNIQML